MINRPYWLNSVDKLWKQKTVVWLSGVRRVGKTFLTRQLPDATYLNCDLPSVQRQLADPEFFLAQQDEDVPLVLDEVHRIEDPSLLLKIAADEFPHIRILATGSSTLEATKKFRDSLTDRKRALHLPPVLWRECLADFDVRDFDRRLLCGGLPEILLKAKPDPAFYEDWMDSFYARDIQELFGVRNRTGFLSLLKLVCLRNGGQLDISDLSRATGMSRPTVMSHLDAMEIAHAVIRIPPYHGGGHREITRQPRIFAFDTGLVAHVKGWRTIREDDRGHLWENLVLDELRAAMPSGVIHYWRDKNQNAIDFVIDRGDGVVDTLEAKITPDALNTRALRAFRSSYSRGTNYLLCPFAEKPYKIQKGDYAIRVCVPRQLQ